MTDSISIQNGSGGENRLKRRAIVFGAGHNFIIMQETISQLYDIVALTDNALEKQGKDVGGFIVQSPNEIAWNSGEVVIITPNKDWEITQELAQKGINASCIIRLGEIFDKAFDGLQLHIAIIYYGGMGDFLIGKNWLYYMAKKYDFSDIITDIYLDSSSYNHSKEIFENDELINSVNSISCGYTSLIGAEYDAVFRFHIVPYIQSFDGEKLVVHKKELLNYILKLQDFGLKNYGLGFCHNQSFFRRMREIMEMMPGRKYHNFCDIFGDLDINDKYLIQLPINRNREEYLSEVGLLGKKFITIDTGQNANYIGKSNTRSWPHENWEQLAQMIKLDYPEYMIVQIGEKMKKDDDITADIHLNGKTDIEDVKVLLKEAELHIDYDGGLVHLRHILGGGPSVVLFGPTLSARHNYDENIAVSANMCGDCEWTTAEWLFDCPSGANPPKCMRSITPKLVYESIMPYLEK